MKGVLFIGAVLFYNTTLGQNSFSLYYECQIPVQTTATGGMPSRDMPDLVLRSRLIFNDSLSFYYFMGNESDEFRRDKEFGKKLVNRAIMYNRNKNEFIYEINLSENEQYIAVDTFKRENWIFLNDTKNILGYNCKSAFSAGGKNDSDLVWYTEEVGKGFGPGNYFGLPGLVLEVFEGKTGQHWIATEKKNSLISITLPVNINRISLKDYLLLKQRDLI